MLPALKYHCRGLSGHSMENRCWVLRWVSQSDSVPSQGVLLTLLSQLDLGSHCGGVSCTHQLCFHGSSTWPAATTQWGHECGTYQGISTRNTPKGRRAKPTVAFACVGLLLYTWGTGGEPKYGVAWNNISKNTQTFCRRDINA